MSCCLRVGMQLSQVLNEEERRVRFASSLQRKRALNAGNDEESDEDPTTGEAQDLSLPLPEETEDLVVERKIAMIARTVREEESDIIEVVMKAGDAVVVTHQEIAGSVMEAKAMKRRELNKRSKRSCRRLLKMQRNKQMRHREMTAQSM